jgi:Zn-dependent protease with chaperone function
MEIYRDIINLNNILPALALGANISCVCFLARSFFFIGYPLLVELGAGAVWEKIHTLFGIRSNIVKNAIQQKAEVVYGLLLLALASLFEFITTALSLKPHFWLSSIFVIITIFIFFYIGHFIVPFFYYCFFVQAAKKSLRIQKLPWLGLDYHQREQKITEQVKLYNLGQFHERRAIKKLQEYISELGAYVHNS